MSLSRLQLPTVTLCAAASVNVPATAAAMSRSLAQVAFADAILFTDAAVPSPTSDLRTVPIARLRSGEDYSEFLLTGLAGHIATEHCLVVQWDGFVLDARQWDPGFLDCDFVGAPWPQFDDGHDVGNGGFSLRSRRLLEACRDQKFQRQHPEDVAIGRTNRSFLEREHGIRFASRQVAERFAFERTLPSRPTFGFHGVFNMVHALGADATWETYRSLDHKSTVFRDYLLMLEQLGGGWSGLKRGAQLTVDLMTERLKRRSNRHATLDTRWDSSVSR